MEEYTIKLLMDGIEWRTDVTGTAKEVYRLSSSMARRCLRGGSCLVVAYTSRTCLRMLYTTKDIRRRAMISMYGGNT